MFKKSLNIVYMISTVFSALFIIPVMAKDLQLSTPQIIEGTLSAIPNCLHYKVIGICFWQQCNASGCTVTTTPKVEHYLPDAVVSVYRQADSNPWDYAKAIIDPNAKKIGNAQIKTLLNYNMGIGNENNSQPTNQNTHFKEVDVIGNPAITIFTKRADVFLPSQAKPLLSYYLSQADAYVWRSPLVEMAMYPLNIVPGRHIVGTLLDNWGNVYPRTGFIDQPADAKAAAVIAERALHIATRATQPHIYDPLNTNNSCGDHCEVWPAIENDINTQWQMVYPKQETQCVMFGSNDLTQATPWEQDAVTLGDGNYAWVMWRHYKGCIQGNGKYIGSIDF